MKPFLKWVGGKQRSAKLIRSHFPTKGVSQYFEPFLGAGGVFLADPYQYEVNHLNDLHSDLIHTWGNIVDQPFEVKQELQKFFIPENNQVEYYYQYRSEFNEEDRNSLRCSALFIYLNKHGFNGLCRYNAQGRFNTPFGKYSKVTQPELPVFDESNDIHFYNADFESFLSSNELNSTCLIYCDPPYIKMNDQSFTGYGTGWSNDDDGRLAGLVKQIVRDTNARIFVSNSYTQRTLDLYAGSQFHIIPTRQGVAANPSTRKASFDYLIEVK